MRRGIHYPGYISLAAIKNRTFLNPGNWCCTSTLYLRPRYEVSVQTLAIAYLSNVEFHQADRLNRPSILSNCGAKPSSRGPPEGAFCLQNNIDTNFHSEEHSRSKDTPAYCSFQQLRNSSPEPKSQEPRVQTTFIAAKQLVLATHTVEHTHRNYSPWSS